MKRLQDFKWFLNGLKGKVIRLAIRHGWKKPNPDRCAVCGHWRQLHRGKTIHQNMCQVRMCPCCDFKAQGVAA